MSRRWVSVFLGAGLLAACSGSNAVIPFEEPLATNGGRDADPTNDATTAAVDARPGLPADDGSLDSSSEAPPDATIADAGDGGKVLEGGDAGDGGNVPEGGDAGPHDAASDAPACPATSTLGNSYVDGTRGVDDAAHGGGPSGCAYKTITYATAHAFRDILVAAGTYSVATGETMPLVLTGRQGITCANAKIVGQGRYQTAQATVVFTGTTNALSGCTIVGNGQPGACVLVASDGTKAGHDIEAVNASHCGDAGVRIAGTLVTIDNSSFHDSDQGISWSSVTQGDMSNDTFSNNADNDIACDPGDSDNQVTGSNDADGQGDPTCSGCANCPFP